MPATRLPSALQVTRRAALFAAWETWIAASGLHSVMAQEAAAVRMQLDQQALNAVPGDERVGLEVTEDTSPAAQDLKERSLPGKTLPIIYLIAGVLSLHSIRGAVQEMLRRHEYGGVVIDTRTSPANIRNDLTAQADSVMVVRADGSTESVRSTLVTEDFLKRVLHYR
jgi:predicted phosphoribosyltransferase